MSSSQARRLPPALGGGNLAFSLRSAAERWPKRVAITHEGRALTLAELELRSARAAAMLRGLGVHAGDRVALQLPNVPAFVDLYFALLRLGAVVVPVNPLLRAAETAHVLGDAEVEILLAWHRAQPPLRGDGTPASVEVLTVREPFDLPGAGEHEPLATIADVDAEQTAVILYTSGTTGQPKGAELTHRNLGLNTLAVVDALSLSAEDVLLGTLPLYHSFGQTCTLNATIAVGARLALLERFDAAAAIELLDREEVTVLMGVPTMLSAIASAREGDGPFPALRLCMSGGAPLPREQLDACERIAGAPVLDSYGLSETSPATTLNRPDLRRIGSVGRPIAGVEVRILAEDGEDLGCRRTGQIAIRGHNVMKGYWRRAEATREAITADGWFLSGDLGELDEDGFLHVVGRLKDVIIRGGLNVYPREVEEALHRHPGVLEAAVVGYPDERLGEEVGAAIVARRGAELEPSALREWIRQRVAPYKYPRRIWLLEELPKGPTGKILKRAISPPEELERG